MTTGSCASTYVTPQPLWRGLIVVVVVVQLMLPPHCEGDWHRLLSSLTHVVTPPMQWTRLCGAPTIMPYCPWQQLVWTYWSPCLGMAAHLQFQGLPLLASCHVQFQGPRFQFIVIEDVGLLSTSCHRTSQFTVIVTVLWLGPQCSGRPAQTLSTSSRSSSSCNSNTGSSSASESALQVVAPDTPDQRTAWVLAACWAARQEQHDKSAFLAQLAEAL
jgi:hypothetical protein